MFSHTLQLVIKDGLRQAIQINKLLTKYAKIVALVLKSILASILLEGECRLQKANIRRWYSLLKIIRSILKVPEDKLDSEAAPQVTLYDRNMVIDLLEILTHFEDATMSVQIENDVASSYILPCMRGLESKLSLFESDYHSKFIETLYSSLLSRMEPYERTKTYSVAAIIVRRFKLRWCRTKSEKQNDKTLLIKVVDQLAKGNANVIESNSIDLSSYPTEILVIAEIPNEFVWNCLTLWMIIPSVKLEIKTVGR